MLLYFICSVQNDEKQFGNFFLDFFLVQSYWFLLSCLLICSGAASCCDFCCCYCFSVRITAVIAGLYRRVLLKKTGKVRTVQ